MPIGGNAIVAIFNIGNFDGFTFADNGLVVQTLQVYGIGGSIDSLRLSLGGLSHTRPEELDMVLSGAPQSGGFTNHYMFWSDVGGIIGITDTDYTITDSAPDALPDDGGFTGGAKRPTAYSDTEFPQDFGITGPGQFTSAPPSGASGNTLRAAFLQDIANGAWSLRVRDSAAGDVGALRAWSLAIETGSSLIDIAGTAGADTIRVNLAGLDTGTYQMNNLPVVAFTGVTGITLSGAGGNDSIFGTFRIETLRGGADRDAVYGFGGNDSLIIDAGDDVAGEIYDGGAGTDQITFFGEGSDTYNLRDDTLVSIEELTFGSAVGGTTDVIQLRAAQIGPGIAANARISGTFETLDPVGGGVFPANLSDQVDVLMDTATSVDLSGWTIRFFDEPGDYVQVVGDGDSETTRGSQAVDYIYGYGGNDNLYGNDANDTLYGYADGDNLYGGRGSDRHYGGDGFDFARYDDADYGNLVIRLDAPSANTGAAAGDTYFDIEGLVGGLGSDTVVGDGGSNHLYGHEGVDFVYGNGGNDRVDGGGGNDNLWGGAGADAHVGGNGFDIARYDDFAWGALTIRLDAPGLNTGVAAGDTYFSIEGVYGGAGNDTIVGDAGVNTLAGLGGADFLYGLGGNDSLVGGGGADRFYFIVAPNAATNMDTITDFEVGIDKIMLDNAVFSGLADGALAAGAFNTGTAATQGDDRIIYNQATGALLFDADGSSPTNGAVQFAMLANRPAGLSAADFFVI